MLTLCQEPSLLVYFCGSSAFCLAILSSRSLRSLAQCRNLGLPEPPHHIKIGPSLAPSPTPIHPSPLGLVAAHSRLDSQCSALGPLSNSAAPSSVTSGFQSSLTAPQVSAASDPWPLLPEPTFLGGASTSDFLEPNHLGRDLSLRTDLLRKVSSSASRDPILVRGSSSPPSR